MAWTQTTLTIKDAAGANQPVIAYTDGTNFSFAHPLLDNTGAIIAPATQGTLAAVLSALQNATPSGTNVIGKVSTDQTAHGTTDLVAADITKVAGAAFALGQQVAGSSLPVVLTAAQLTALTAPVLGAGNNLVGKFSTDQTAHGTTDLVAADVTKVAGAAFALGQQLAGSSLPVVLTAAQLAALTAPVLGAGSAVAGKFGIDQTTPGTTNLVYLPAPLIVAGATITRPADTNVYAAGDLLAASTTAATVNGTPTTIAAARANDMPGTILRMRLKKSGTTLTNGIFRIHLYNSAPTVSNGDNGVWLSTTSGYVGAFDVTMTQAFTDSCMGIGIPISGSGVAFAPATGTQNLYYLIEVRAAYTPVSGEVFTPYVELQ